MAPNLPLPTGRASSQLSAGCSYHNLSLISSFTGVHAHVNMSAIPIIRGPRGALDDMMLMVRFMPKNSESFVYFFTN